MSATASQERLDVVFAADEGFIPHLCVAVMSLLETNRDILGRVFIITDSAESPEYDLLCSFVLDTYGFELETISRPLGSIEDLYTSAHISTAAYNRFLVGELLPASVRKVLYLDCDLIVKGSLEQLLSPLEVSVPRNNLDAPVLLAIAREDPTHLRPFGHTRDEYFNSGVLLIDLDQWRKQKVGDELIHLARRLHGSLHLHDQDALNLVLEERWLELPGIYNETTAVDHRSESALIIHYAGVPKPWMYGSTHPHSRDYEDIRLRSPFVPYRKQGLGRFLIKRFVPRPLQKPRKTVRRIGRKISRALRLGGR